jgi:hypothetical protein
MRSPAHLPTLRGLGPDGDQLTDDDIVEVDGEAPPKSGVRYAMVTVPASRPPPHASPARYSLVATRRRRTLRGNGSG